MINLFFKDIKEIPEYIDFEYSNKFNDVEAQRLLNEYLSVNKVAQIMNCSPHSIYDAIQHKRITYPPNYKKNDCVSIVQLSLQKEFIAEYDSIAEAQRVNRVKGISSALGRNLNYCGGYYWVKTDDYYSNNYCIKDTRLKVS